MFAEAFAAQRLPVESLLPIACDGGGSHLFLDLSPEGRGRVLAFVFGLPEWTGLTRNDASGVLAENFDEYLDALFIDEDTAELAWEDINDAPPTDLWRRTIEEWLDPGLPGWRTRPWAH